MAQFFVQAMDVTSDLEVLVRCLVYAMRHGEKDGDKLTELGKRQVVATFMAHLRGPIDEIYSSPLHRTRQTADIVAQNAQMDGFVPNEGFGQHWLEEPVAGMPTLQEFHKNLLAITPKPTPDDWLRNWPRAWEWRGRFVADMLTAAAVAVYGEGNQLPAPEIESHRRPARIVICSHDPVIALAADESIRGQALGFSDVVRYEIKFSEKHRGGTIVESALLKCPM